MLQYTVLDVAKRPFVIYKDSMTNQICLDPRQGPCRKKAMIISLPHAGVHMVQKIFESLGLYHVRVKHDKNILNDYRFLSDDDRIKVAQNNVSYVFPISESYKWIIDGQVTHNHLRYDDMTYTTLRDSDMMVYLLKRDLRNCVVSHAKQKQKENMLITTEHNKILDMYIMSPYYNELIETIKMQMSWFENKTFDTLSFEPLSGSCGKDIQYQSIIKLLDDLEITESYDYGNIGLDNIIKKSIGVKTFSFSGENSNWVKYWSPLVEKWYEDTGLKCMNEKLGYS